MNLSALEIVEIVAIIMFGVSMLAPIFRSKR